MIIYFIYSGKNNGVWILKHSKILNIEKLYEEQGKGDTQVFVDWLIDTHYFTNVDTIDLFTD